MMRWQRGGGIARGGSLSTTHTRLYTPFNTLTRTNSVQTIRLYSNETTLTTMQGWRHKLSFVRQPTTNTSILPRFTSLRSVLAKQYASRSHDKLASELRRRGVIASFEGGAASGNGTTSALSSFATRSSNNNIVLNVTPKALKLMIGFIAFYLTSIGLLTLYERSKWNKIARFYQHNDASIPVSNFLKAIPPSYMTSLLGGGEAPVFVLGNGNEGGVTIRLKYPHAVETSLSTDIWNYPSTGFMYQGSLFYLLQVSNRPDIDFVLRIDVEARHEQSDIIQIQATHAFMFVVPRNQSSGAAVNIRVIEDRKALQFFDGRFTINRPGGSSDGGGGGGGDGSEEDKNIRVIISKAKAHAGGSKPAATQSPPSSPPPTDTSNKPPKTS